MGTKTHGNLSYYISKPSKSFFLYLQSKYCKKPHLKYFLTVTTVFTAHIILDFARFLATIWSTSRAASTITCASIWRNRTSRTATAFVRSRSGRCTSTCRSSRACRSCGGRLGVGLSSNGRACRRWASARRCPRGLHGTNDAYGVSIVL